MMRSYNRVVWVFASTLVALFPGRAVAQGTDTVPMELALALLRSPGDGLRLLVGKTPEQFPSQLTPASSKLLGSAQRDLSTTAVFISTLDPRDAMISWERGAARAGWTRPPGYAPVQRNGFISSNTPLGIPVFCSNGIYASLTAHVRFDGGSTLLMQYSDPSVQSLCSATRSETAANPQVVVTQDTMPVPALLPPAGLSVVQYANRETVDNWEQHARISGAKTASGVLQHYANQLTSAGFTAAAPAMSEGTATQTFRRKLPDSGFDISVSIVVLANPFDTTSMNAQLSVFRRR